MRRLSWLILVVALNALAQNPGPALTGAIASGVASSVIRSSNVTSSTSTSSVTSPIPAGAVAGDLCVFVIQAKNLLSTVSGWSVAQNSAQSYWNGGIVYKTLSSGDITSGITANFTSPGEVIMIGVDFNPSITSYVASSSSGNGGGTDSSVTSPTLSGVSTGNTVLWMAGMRGNGIPSVSRGSLVETYAMTPPYTGTLSVYSETLLSGFSSSVTYNFPGVYNPQGWLTGWIAVQ